VLAEQWRKETRDAFLVAYEDEVRSSGLYGSSGRIRPGLRLFEMEKALYELRYEINNRPEWTGIVLQGLLVILE
jgi:maltose alpha-D-glucosyltransferase/alpha-amylase